MRVRPVRKGTVVLVLVGIACAAVVLTGVVEWYWIPEHGIFRPQHSGPPDNGSSVVISEIDLIVWYNGSPAQAGYLLTADCNCFPQTVNSSTYNYVITVTDNSSVSHNITGFSVDAPFKLLSTAPVPPRALSAGTPYTFTLVMLVPTSPGHYAVTGSVDTD